MPTTMRKIRSLQAEIIARKQDILDKCLNKKIECYVGGGSSYLCMNSFSPDLSVNI